MSNMPDVNKIVKSIRLPLELAAKLRKLAIIRKMTLTQILNFILHEELDGIPLDDDDMDWMAKERAKNESKRN